MKFKTLFQFPLHIGIMIFSATFFLQCSASNFNGSSRISGKKDHKKSTTKKQPEPTLENDVVTSQSEPEVKCWFALSGTWLAWDGAPEHYDESFPKTHSGNPIGQGELFDTKGGVFLLSSDEPYIYGEGKKEIDKAVDDTFDSIAVSPGLQVEIRNEDGEVIFKGEGPYWAESLYAHNLPQYTGKYYASVSKISDLPKWMERYLKTNKKLEVLPLQSGRWVKVTAKSNSECDWSD